MNNTITQLFVYGSLRSGFKNDAYHYLSKYFDLVGEGTVKGKLYDNGNYPVAVATTEENFLVGELYSVKTEAEFFWAIEQLDDYEGLNVEANETPLYVREQTTVYINNQQTTAWVYWYNKPVDKFTPIASNDVMQYLQQKNK
jgi:gamma-glutamylcyclotransferase (GGCT)/AIG2-like uncharacterized protein YtfP